MIEAIREVDPAKADEHDKMGTDVMELRKFIYDHNYKIRGKYDS